jgi:hypothetical protein
MSGTETLVEIVLTLPKTKRAAWRKLLAAKALAVLSSVPREEGRLELEETAKTVTARAFFSEEAETRAEMLIDAFRAAAKLGAVGEGTYFLLVDYQREEGYALAIGDGTSSLAKLPARRAKAKHPTLDAFFEKCVVAPAAPVVAASALQSASALALAKLKDRPAPELLAAWQRVKSTTMTSGAFVVSRSDEKKLLSLAEQPPRWPWLPALPVRLLAEFERDEAERVVHSLLADSTIAGEPRWMLLEALSGSQNDAALDAIVAACAGDAQNAAARALAFSVHPRASTVVVDRSREWLERTAQHPERLPQGNDFEAIHVLATLQLRADRAACDELRAIWQRFYDLRARIPRGSEATPVFAAMAYADCALKGLDDTSNKSVRAARPPPRSTLEEWAKFIAVVDANRVT